MTMPRQKRALNVYVDPDLLDRLDAWLAAQALPPSKTAFVERAVRELLDKMEAAPTQARKGR